MKGQKWVVPLSTVFLSLMQQQKGCHVESNTKVKLYNRKHLPEMGRCLHKMSLVTRPQLKTNRPLNVMQKSLHNTTLKTFVLNNEIIKDRESKLYMNIQWQLLRTAFQLRVQDRAHFSEDNIYHYRQWNRSGKSVTFTLSKVITFDILNLAVIEKHSIFALTPVKSVKHKLKII